MVRIKQSRKKILKEANLYRSFGRSLLAVAEISAGPRGVGHPCLIQVLFNSLRRSNGFSKKPRLPPMWLAGQVAFPGLEESSERYKTPISGGFLPGASVFRTSWLTVRPSVIIRSSLLNNKKAEVGSRQSSVVSRQKNSPANCQLPTANCLLSTVYCLPSTVYCLLSTVYRLLYPAAAG